MWIVPQDKELGKGFLKIPLLRRLFMSEKPVKTFNPLPYLSPLPPVVMPQELLFLFGWEKAVLFQHIYYWMGKNAANGRNFHDGKYWTYDTIPALQNRFPYMNERQVRYHLEKLEEMGVIIKGDYNINRTKRPNWYTVDLEKYNELIDSNKDAITLFIRNCLTDETCENTDAAREDKIVKSVNAPLQEENCKNGSVAQYLPLRQKRLIEKTKTAIHNNRSIHTEAYFSNNNNAQARADKNSISQKEAELISPNWKPSDILRTDAITQFPTLVDEDLMAACVKKYVERNLAKQVKRLEWDDWFLGHCRWWIKNPGSRAKVKATTVVSKEPRTPIQELWDNIKACLLKWNHGLSMYRCAFSKLEAVDLNAEYLTVKIPANAKTDFDEETCQRLFVIAKNLLKIDLKGIQIVMG